MSTRIAITMNDGSLQVMEFLNEGRGSVIPFGAAQFGTDAEGRKVWGRPASDENIEHELARTYENKPEQPVSWRVLDKGEADLPADRAYRPAWTDAGAGAVVHDMEKAKAYHLEKLRAERLEALGKLDADWMRATGQKNDQTVIDAIEAQRQALRDVTDDPRIAAAKTVDDLKLLTLAETASAMSAVAKG